MLFTLRTIHDFYFRAMREAGYQTHTPRTTIPELPGSKVIVFEDGELKLVDCWHTRGQRSSGTTTIFVPGGAVWQMHYWGEYRERAIPMLRQALAADYNDTHLFDDGPNLFNGCRGPRCLRSHFQPDTLYINTVRPGSTFGNFSGREEIRCGIGASELDGWHEYHGFSLIP